MSVVSPLCARGRLLAAAYRVIYTACPKSPIHQTAKDLSP